MKKIFVKDFTLFPGPRYRKLGQYSGEEYREDVLIPELLANDELCVDLDGVYGYGSSFLEEAFGRLVHNNVPVEKVRMLSENLVCSDSSVLEEVREYIADSIK